jgi:hypothetical protein
MENILVIILSLQKGMSIWSIKLNAICNMRRDLSWLSLCWVLPAINTSTMLLRILSICYDFIWASYTFNKVFIHVIVLFNKATALNIKVLYWTICRVKLSTLIIIAYIWSYWADNSWLRRRLLLCLSLWVPRRDFLISALMHSKAISYQ